MRSYNEKKTWRIQEYFEMSYNVSQFLKKRKEIAKPSAGKMELIWLLYYADEKTKWYKNFRKKLVDSYNVKLYLSLTQQFHL